MLNREKIGLMTIRHMMSLILIITLLSCTTSPPPAQLEPTSLSQMGPRTTVVDSKAYGSHFYVSVSTGNDDNNGSQESPWASLTHAIKTASENTAIHVAQGNYLEGELQLKVGQAVFGGYLPDTWERNINDYPTMVSGEGERRLFLGAQDAHLDGLTLTEGLLRGHGAALSCIDVDMTMSNCIVKANRTLGPEDWAPIYRHEISNDGGAVYAADGSDLTLQNNIFALNTTENGRGAAVALHSHCNGVIQGNVFYANVAGDNDPLRSSDGGALSIFDWSSPLVENNIFLDNEALTKNDAGGIFVALWSAPRIRNNILVRNISGDDAGAIFVGGQEHRYDAPLDSIPGKAQFYVRIEDNVFHGNRNNAGKPGNSGVMRFTMESRGLIAGNIMAENPGFYIQRSEADVRNNTILEPFIFIETKEGLQASYAEGNIISDTLNMDENPAPVTFANNILAGDSRWKEQNTHVRELGLDDTPTAVHVETSEYLADQFKTNILLTETLTIADLNNRAVRSGDIWGIINEVNGNHLMVWGNLSGVDTLEIMPSYKPLAGSPSMGFGAHTKLKGSH